MIFIALVGITALVQTVHLADLNGCSTKLEPIGCYQDDVMNRVLPEQILNERDVTSEVYGGRLISWKNFEKYLPGFICRCAKKAFAKGYRVIGVQFYGECWSGPVTDMEFDRLGKADTCVNNKFEKYDNRTDCIPATGLDSTNYVYRIAPTVCDTYYEAVGCFHDTMVVPRPLPNYISNERDFSHKYWNGRLIQWENWLTYSPEMICRCATLAKEKGHDLFAIQFWGECWSGTNSEVNPTRDGTSLNCRNEHFKTCPCNSYHCVGKAQTNHVYKLINGPAV